MQINWIQLISNIACKYVVPLPDEGSQLLAIKGCVHDRLTGHLFNNQLLTMYFTLKYKLYKGYMSRKGQIISSKQRKKKKKDFKSVKLGCTKLELTMTLCPVLIGILCALWQW